MDVSNQEMNRQLEWHASQLPKALQALDAGMGGLSAVEAKTRLDSMGPNKLRPPKKRSALARFLAQLNNILIYVLICAAVAKVLLGHYVDASVIAGVVVINAFIGYIQEGKAENALEAIRNMLSLNATVMRDGSKIDVPAEELVPGDVVFLQPGDKVPADIRLIETKNLGIQEAVLTGESVPIEKSPKEVAAESSVGDRTCLAYSGTLVASGQGTGVVFATGERTEIGRIGKMLSEVETLTTPLLRKLDQLGWWLTFAILGITVLIFIYGILVQGYQWVDMFIAAVGVAVAAIPEGLPAVMTIALALGVQRMAKHHAIIRELPAVETLGSVTVICSDKTGTLTRNEMTVQDVVTAKHLVEVSGVGYAPEGGFRCDGQDIDPADRPVLSEALRAVVLCNEAVLRHKDGEWHMEGDPTEGSLLTMAGKAAVDVDLTAKQYPRTDVIPFDSEYKYMATLHHDEAGEGVIYVKGAPERLLAMCDRQAVEDGDQPLDLDYWKERSEEIASKGRRLLAVARKPAGSDQRRLAFEDVEGGLTLMGLFGIIDPPRPEAIRAVAECQSAGIRVKMITGDHSLTAAAIGRELALEDTDRVISGREIDELDDDALRPIAKNVSVFARTTPEHKLRLVQALQEEGEITAMTGDGVNDAPALRRADIGVAMGIKGTEAAKDASKMVLADDNFASLENAVEEGRTVYDNLRKSLLFILPTNVAQACVIIAAVLVGTVLPIEAVQILWVNMVSAVTLALALSFEPGEPDIMKRKPRSSTEPLLTGLLLWRIGFVAAIIVIGTFWLFLWEMSRGATIEYAQTVAVNAVILFQIFYLFNARHILRPTTLVEGITGNRMVLVSIGAMIVLQALFTYVPVMHTLFGTAPIGLDSWGMILAISVLLFPIVEAEKWILRRVLDPSAATA